MCKVETVSVHANSADSAFHQASWAANAACAKGNAVQTPWCTRRAPQWRGCRRTPRRQIAAARSMRCRGGSASWPSAARGPAPPRSRAPPRRADACRAGQNEDKISEPAAQKAIEHTLAAARSTLPKPDHSGWWPRKPARHHACARVRSTAVPAAAGLRLCCFIAGHHIATSPRAHLTVCHIRRPV